MTSLFYVYIAFSMWLFRLGLKGSTVVFIDTEDRECGFYTFDHVFSLFGVSWVRIRFFFFFFSFENNKMGGNVHVEVFLFH